MARSNNVAFATWKGKQGSFKKQIVYRKRGETTFVSKFPDMSKVKPSVLQSKGNDRFAAAVRFAQEIVHDPIKKANYPVRKGKTVYHTAIIDYLDRHWKDIG